MKNKILGILLVMVLAVTGFGLVGCGGKTTPVTPTPTPEPEVPELVDSLVPVAMDETGLLFTDPYTPGVRGSDEVDTEEVTMEIGVNGLEKAVAEVVIPAYVVDEEDVVYRVTLLDDYAFTVGGEPQESEEYAYSEGAADDEDDVELVKITLPSTVEYVCTYTFAGCTALEEIVLNNRETVIEGLYDAFINLSDEVMGQMEDPSEYLGTHLNTEDDGLYYLGNTKHPYMYLVMAYGEDFYPQEEEAPKYVLSEGAVDTTDGVKVTINADCKVIGDLAFANSAITEVVLPEGLVAIGNCAFSSSDSANKIHLGDIILPETVKHIGFSAFNYSIISDLYIPSKVEVDMNEVFWGVEVTGTLYLNNEFMVTYNSSHFAAWISSGNEIYVLASVDEEIGGLGQEFNKHDNNEVFNNQEYVVYDYDPILE